MADSPDSPSQQEVPPHSRRPLPTAWEELLRSGEEERGEHMAGSPFDGERGEETKRGAWIGR